MNRTGRGYLLVLTLGFAVCVLGAVLLGFRLGREAAEASPPLQATVPSIPSSAPGANTLDADQSRTIATEVAKLVAAQGCPASVPKLEPAGTVLARQPASPEAEQAKQALQQLLDHAFSAGEWTNDDAFAFRRLAAKLALRDRVAMMNTLYDGLNSKRLARRFHGPPM